MRRQLAGWCVLLAVAGSSLAADKPKKKEKPQTIPPPGGVIELAKPTDQLPAGIRSVTGDLLGSDADHGDTKFVITKPVGTWVRDIDLGEANCRFALKFTDNRLALHIDAIGGGKTFSGRLDVDYSINKESVLFGVIDSFDAKSEKMEADKLAPLAKLSGQPFAVRFRVEDDGLTFKDFKGLGVGSGEKEPELITGALLMLNGRYTKADSSKPLPPLKSSKKKESDGGSGFRLGGLPYPTPHYLKHYPTYIAPEPAFPLQRERDELLDPTGEIRRGTSLPPPLAPLSCGPTTDTTAPKSFVAYAGPVNHASSELFTLRPSAELIAAGPVR